VHGGEFGGILARVYREGTAGDPLLSGAGRSASSAWLWHWNFVRVKVRRIEGLAPALPGYDVPM